MYLRVTERKELKTFSKLQKTPPMRRNKKVSTNISAIEDENRIDTKIYRNHYHLDRDSLPINVSTIFSCYNEDLIGN